MGRTRGTARRGTPAPWTLGGRQRECWEACSRGWRCQKGFYFSYLSPGDDGKVYCPGACSGAEGGRADWRSIIAGVGGLSVRPEVDIEYLGSRPGTALMDR